MNISDRLRRKIRHFAGTPGVVDATQVPPVSNDHARTVFDDVWYFSQLQAAGIDLDPDTERFTHFIDTGGTAGLSPHPIFDSAWYLTNHPDVAAANINPLLHYLAHGHIEERRPSPLFDGAWYVEAYPDVKANRLNPLVHYLEFGAREGRNPNAWFDTSWYADTYLAGPSDRNDALKHYISEGEQDGNKPSPRFDPKWYRFDNAGIPASDLALAHFLLVGEPAARPPLRGPNNFSDATQLRNRLSELAPSVDAQRASADLKLRSVQQFLAQSTGTPGITAVLQHTSRTAEGITGAAHAFPPSPYLARIDDVYALSGTRFLITPKSHLLHDEMYAFRDEPGAAVKFHAARHTEGGFVHIGFDIRQGAWVDRGISLMHEYSNNYFHFLAETLPRMMLAEEASLPLDIPFLVETKLHANMLQLLEMANIKKRPILFLETQTLYHVAELYLPADTTSVVDAYDGGEIARQSLLDVARIRQAVQLCRIQIETSVRPVKRRIYAGRSSGSIRALKNQKALETLLAGMGFEILRTEDLNVETQIKIFQDAEIVVAPTGAQLTNIAWCAPGTRIIVLASDHPSHQLYLWELLGRVSACDVHIVQGPRAYTRDDKYAIHDDYSIDLNEVLSLIDD